MSSDTRTDDAGSTFDHQVARIAVGAYDDSQETRKAFMNRVRDVVRKRREDISFDEVEDEKEGKQDYAAEYADENLGALVEEMAENGELTDHEFAYLSKMLDAAERAAKVEQDYRDLFAIAENEPIYSEWLTDVYGISHTLAARLLHAFGYNEDRENPSQLWAYAGLKPSSQRRSGQELDYDPDAKTLAWLIADSMIKGGDRSRYRVEFYDPYKSEQIKRMKHSECKLCGEPTHEHERIDGGGLCPDLDDVTATLGEFDINHSVPDNATPPWNRAHADARARRYLAKKFLRHYWYHTRDMKGLPTKGAWIVEEGGHDKRPESFENPEYAKRAVTDPTE